MNRIHKDIILFIGITTIQVINVLILYSFLFSLIFLLVQVSFLLICFLRRKYLQFSLWYSIFLASSFEFDVFVMDGTIPFYGFKRFEILGINFALLFLVFLFFILLMREFKKLIFLNRYIRLRNFLLILLILFFGGILFGFVSIITNENNIQQVPSFLILFLNESYYYLWFLLLSLFYFFGFNLENHKLNYKISNYPFLFLLSNALNLIIVYFLGLTGTYGPFDIILAPLSTWFIPFLILYINEFKISIMKFFVFFIYLFSTLLLIIYNPNGKVIIFVILAILLQIKKHFKLSTLPFILLGLISSVSFIIFISNIDLYLFTNNQLLINKITDVTTSFSFWESNWFDNISISPKYRILEFLTIIEEFVEKPYFAFFGKGYLGSVSDHLNFFYISSSGTFSQVQFDYGFFYAMHETLNEMFLQHGLLGITTFLFFGIYLLKKSNHNNSLTIGLVWFLLLYGFGLTLGAFGSLFIFPGFYTEDIRKNRISNNV